MLHPCSIHSLLRATALQKGRKPQLRIRQKENCPEVSPPLPGKGSFLIINSADKPQNQNKMLYQNEQFCKVSEVKISYHNRIKLAESPQINNSGDAVQILHANWSDDLELLETFNILILNRANRVKGIFTVSKGGVSGTVVDAKIVFAAALKAMACGIILAHNHPSGNRYPSEADIKLTSKLKEAGQALDITVIDHLILTTGDYYSFADEGKL